MTTGFSRMEFLINLSRLILRSKKASIRPKYCHDCTIAPVSSRFIYLLPASAVVVLRKALTCGECFEGLRIERKGSDVGKINGIQHIDGQLNVIHVSQMVAYCGIPRDEGFS